MKFPLDIVFGHLRRSARIERLVRENTALLDDIHDRILYCQFVVDALSLKERTLSLRLSLSIPGNEIVVEHRTGMNCSLEILRRVIRASFQDAHDQVLAARVRWPEVYLG